MANQMMLVFLALAVGRGVVDGATCGADDDGNTVHSEFKPNLADRWCSTEKSLYASCSGQCCQGRDVCSGSHGSDVMNGVVTCATAAHVPSFALAGVVTTEKTANVDCCEAEKKCDSFTCPSGWKAITAAATTTCKNQGNVCSRNLCCDVEDQTCAGQQTAWSAEVVPLACGSGTEYDNTKATSAMGSAKTFGMWQSSAGNGCCKVSQTCLGAYVDKGYKCRTLSTDVNVKDLYEHKFASSASTAFTGTTEKAWMETCCTQTLTKCSAYACKAGLALVSNHNQDTSECMEGVGFGSSKVGDNAAAVDGFADACQATCCKKDPRKCRGYPEGNMHDDEKCGAKHDHDFKDDSGDFNTLGMKMNNVVTDHSTYKRQCCSARLSCKNFQDGQAEPQPPAEAEAMASATMRQHASVAAPLLVALEVYALSK